MEPGVVALAGDAAGTAIERFTRAALNFAAHAGTHLAVEAYSARDQPCQACPAIPEIPSCPVNFCPSCPETVCGGCNLTVPSFEAVCGSGIGALEAIAFGIATFFVGTLLGKFLNAGGAPRRRGGGVVVPGGR